MYSDDVDLSYRMLLKGKSNYYYPETTVIHYKGESTVKDGIYMKRFQESMQFSIKKLQGFSILSVFYENRILFFFVKMFQGRQKKKTPESYILYSSTELISKMESNFKIKYFS
jgi:GT2 family glycosyltransferase